MISNHGNPFIALITYLKQSKNWTYLGFLIRNCNTIVESAPSLITTTTLTLDTWPNFDAAWLKHFLENAEKLLESSNFITFKEKVFIFFILHMLLGNS